MVVSTTNRMVANGCGWLHQPSMVAVFMFNKQIEAKMQPFNLLRRLTERSQLGSLYLQSDSSV